MKIAAVLRTWNARPADGYQAIVFRVHAGNDTKYTKPIEWVPPSWWDEDNRCVRRLVNGKRNDAEAERINTNIAATRLKIERYVKEHPGAKPKEICRRYIMAKDDERFTADGRRTASMSLFDYFDKRIEDGETGRIRHPKTGLPLTPASIVNWKTTRVRLRAYAGRHGSFDWDDINRILYDNLIDFLRYEYRTKSGTLLRENSIGKTIDVLKALINAAQDQELPGLPVITAHTRSWFISPEVDVDTEVLNVDQIDAIRRLDLQWHPQLDEERQRFLIRYNTLMRESDSVAMSEGNILVMNGQRFVKKVQQKTSQPVVVPCTLEAYDAIMAGVKAVANQKSNKLLKSLCERAGFDALRTHHEIIGGKRITTTVPQWMRITTHTARRSVATQLYLWDEEVNDIQRWGGWTAQPQAEKYIKVKLWEHSRDMKKRGEFFRSSFI